MSYRIRALASEQEAEGMVDSNMFTSRKGRLAQRRHFCSACQPNAASTETGVIAPGHPYLHLTNRGSGLVRQIKTRRECISCVARRPSSDTPSCTKSCCNHVECVFPQGHSGTHGCTSCSFLQDDAWRPVPGFGGWATADGRIRGLSGKLLKHQSCPRGYLHVNIGHRPRKKLPVHHAVLLAFGFPRPEGAECRHLDGNKSNNALSNLRWGTSKENAADRAAHGHTGHGEAGSQTKLTTEHAFAIRSDRRSSRRIAAAYGVTHTTVLNIRRKRTWSAALEEAQPATVATETVLGFEPGEGSW